VSELDAKPVSPKELVKMFLEQVSTHPLNTVMHMYVESLKDLLDTEIGEISWHTALELIAWFYILDVFSALAFAYVSKPHTPIGIVINRVLSTASTEPIMCRMFLPLVQELKNMNSMMAGGIPTECPPLEADKNNEVPMFM